MSTGIILLIGVGVLLIGRYIILLVGRYKAKHNPMIPDEIRHFRQYVDRHHRREPFTVAEAQGFYRLTKRAFWMIPGVKSMWVMLVTGMIYRSKRRGEKKIGGSSGGRNTFAQ